MTRIALFSDVHGSVCGLRRVLDHVRGADRIVCAGDILSGGPGLDDTMELLLENKVLLLGGNFEAVLRDTSGNIHLVSANYRSYILRTCQWVRGNLSLEYLNILAELPLSVIIPLSAGRSLLVCHAAMNDPWMRICAADAPREDLIGEYGSYPQTHIAYGHYHCNHVMELDGKMLINVAGVGLRSDGMAHYTIIEDNGNEILIHQRSVSYDIAAEQALMRQRQTPQPILEKEE